MLDVLVPTYNRPMALAVTLATLVGQTFRDFRVVISDQSDSSNVADEGAIQAVLEVLRHHGKSTNIYLGADWRNSASFCSIGPRHLTSYFWMMI